MQKCFVFHIFASKHIINKRKFNINVQRNKPLCLARILKKIENWICPAWFSLISIGACNPVGCFTPLHINLTIHGDITTLIKKKPRFKCFYVTRANNI